MYCSWTFQYFLFPFFLDTNSDGFQPIAFWTAVVYVIFSGLYDLLFSIYFSYILVLDYMDIRRMSSVNRSFSVKFMIHFVFRYLYMVCILASTRMIVFSAVASALMNFAHGLTNPGESIVYVCILLIGIHLLFNFKIDKVVFRNNKVTPVVANHGSRGSCSGSGNSNSERHLSIALNNMVRILGQQARRISGSAKTKPVPAGRNRASFNDIGQMMDSNKKEDHHGMHVTSDDHKNHTMSN